MGRRRGGSGLFRPARNKWIADRVSFESVKKAREGWREIRDSFEKALKRRDRDRALQLARAIQNAANRAKASRRRKHLSREVRSRLKKLEEFYEKRADWMWEKYEEIFG